MKKTLAVIIIIIIAVGVVYVISPKSEVEQSPTTKTPETPAVFDGRNSSFMVDDLSIKLVDGASEVPAETGSAVMISTQYFGNEANGDLNADGKDDVAFLIAQDGGGSGLFYYVVVAVRTTDGYQTLDAAFIGDRIAPQTTEINSAKGELRVNYADRGKDEPMTADPTIGVTKVFKIGKNGTLEARN